MIMVTGQNPLGHVIHMIAGPETDLFQDIHGAKILDLTEVIKSLQSVDHLFISFTRCKSEPMTEAMLKAANIPYTSSFTGISEVTQVGTTPKKEGSKIVQEPKTKCQYCHRETELLPVPGFKICAVCAQIELGQLKTRKVKDTSHA
jgi:hypothetical protein